jgi:hypothetical protein
MVAHPIFVSGARLRSVAVALLIGLAPCLFPADAAAQACPGSDLVTGLHRPMGIAASNLGNLIVSETGTSAAHRGRISIVGLDGVRRTLIVGLPSGTNDVAEPSGPAGLIMRGRTIYVLLGIGDSVLPAQIPTRHLPNPAVSSPIYSSVLAIHLSAHVERSTRGFTLSAADQQTLADGRRVMLSNGGGDTIEIELIADFPDYVPDPLPGNPALVRGSNPFALAIRAETLFVTDGGRNLVWAVDLASKTHSVLATFPPIPNPVPGFGPVVEAVPTGIEYVNGRLLATLFRGVPFPAGTSTVVEIDPETGAYSSLIGGLKTAIGITQLAGTDSYLVLQHSSGFAPFFGGPGVVLGFGSPSSAPHLLADCLARPTTMWFDAKRGHLYVAELLSGRIVTLAFEF